MLNSVKPMLMCAIAAMGLLFGSCSGDKSDEPNSEKDTKVSFIREYSNPDDAREYNYNTYKSGYDKLFNTAWVLSTVNGKSTKPVGSRMVLTFRNSISCSPTSNGVGEYECFATCGSYPDSWQIMNNKLYLFRDGRFGWLNQLTPEFMGTWSAVYEASLLPAENGVAFEVTDTKLTIQSGTSTSVFTQLDFSKYKYGGYENRPTYSGYLSNEYGRLYADATQVPDVGFVDSEYKGTKSIKLRFRILNKSSCGYLNAHQVNYGTRYLVERKETSWENGYLTVTLDSLKPSTTYKAQCHVKNEKGVGSSEVISIATSL